MNRQEKISLLQGLLTGKGLERSICFWFYKNGMYETIQDKEVLTMTKQAMHDFINGPGRLGVHFIPDERFINDGSYDE